MPVIHPLEPLTREELATAVQILSDTGNLPLGFRIVSITLKEPPKELVLKWKEGDRFIRIAEAVLIDRTENRACKVTVDLAQRTTDKVMVPAGFQPMFCDDEVLECEEAIMNSTYFWSKIKEHFGDSPLVKKENLVVEAWSTGYYGKDELEGRRLARFICSFKDPVTETPYTYPIASLCPVLDLNSMQVVSVEEYQKVPLPPRHYDSFVAKNMEDELRKDLKPLEIVQPMGASFRVRGNTVTWQKWSFVVGFNAREGLVIHDIRFDGRPILYRAALSEMVVPYGDPDPPETYKNAFDTGEYGLGNCAVSLKLGCDCLGKIHYFDGELVRDRGDPWSFEKVICMHEEDYGTLWRHYDRHYDKEEVRRSQRLVVSFFCVVDNYDYGFFWYLYQDGNIQYEVKLTGFVSTTSLGNDDIPKYGTLMAPRIYAPNHQHWFNCRLDFALDGVRNSVSQVDVVPEMDEVANKHRNAFYAAKTTLTTEQQAKARVCIESDRTWEVFNGNVRNYLGQPIAYKLIPGDNVTPLADPDAYWRRRAQFVDHHVYVTPYNKDEYFAAGEWPNQSKEDHGLSVWTKQNRNIENTDVVMWYSFGVTHVPRPEDYPVMPVSYTGFLLKPYGFFDRNPAWDVPPPDIAAKDLEGPAKL